MTIALRLAEFTQSDDPANVSQRVRAKAQLHILDTLGCIAFTTELDYASALIDAIAVDSGDFGLPGVLPRLTFGDAALIGGTLAAGFELDDVGVFVHPGACIVPVAFLAAEEHTRRRGVNVSGSALLAAVIVGYEVTVRLSDWIGFGPEDEVGWHTPAFHGAIGAAATASRIWGLSLEETTHAIASAADIAGGGLMQARFGSDIKRVHTGRAAQSGVLAARLAAAGIRGRTDVFEDPRWGYFRTIRYRGVSETEESLRGEPVLRGLGEEYPSFDKIALKYYPCTAGAQGIHDNVIAACEELEAGPGDIEGITVQVSSWFYDQPETLRPATGIESANFSYAYAAAVAAVERAPRLTEEGADVRTFVSALSDPRVRAMQDRVKFSASTVIDAENRYSMDTIVEVKLFDGRSATFRSSYGVKSTADNDGAIAFASVDADGVARKFRTLTASVLEASTAESVIGNIGDLVNVEDVLPLWRSLQVKRGTSNE